MKEGELALVLLKRLRSGIYGLLKKSLETMIMEMGEVRICSSLSLFGLKMEGWFLNQFLHRVIVVLVVNHFVI